ncbi:2-hydroxyacid dehydrogenase [Methylobacterium longum]|uniref:2-hydroxyacid dehydrogenase n=1 Tax=Methylobacterium longum TaxID=767694 RepID=A0ABT8AUX5_9HYPH|nr:2-hydroxyacid dehydrogenase [Methylobacterium longum]MDN3573759.1 2-hydroxyacid dehydrogenase [Methylobacterium longum]GJE11253.1 2-ketogluconate reductase [Methylobacterium longum]
MPDAAADILFLRKMHPLVETSLDGRHNVHRLAGAADPEAMLETIGPRIRGLCVGGQVGIDGALMDRLPNLEIIANFGVGYDAVDAAEAHRRGVIVTNTPDVLTDEVADLAIGLVLATLRRLPQADRYLREGHWPKAPFPLTASLRGRRVGILGLGRIGRAIAKRLESFGVEIAYHGRRRQSDAPYAYHDSLVGLAQAVHVLIVVAPGGSDTRGLVDTAVLEALGPEGILVNVARGSLVDEAALTAALKAGTILGAGLDVFENEPHVPSDLAALENTVLLPHVGSASEHTRAAMAQLVVDNVISWFEGRGPLTPVGETPWKPKA